MNELKQTFVFIISILGSGKIWLETKFPKGFSMEHYFQAMCVIKVIFFKKSSMIA